MAWQARSPNRLPTRQWRKLRAAILAAEPFCRVCTTAGILTRDSVATEVDHITALASGGTNDPANLQPICADCHVLKTAQEAATARGAAPPTSIKPRLTFGPDGWPV